jgi:ABC-type transport system involved in multi-copper enzyme maturation permease subunit
MTSLRASLLLARHAFAATLRGRRLLVLLFLAAMPVAVSFLIVHFHPHVGPDDFLELMLHIVLQAVMPLLALVAGVAVLGDEIDGRTVTYLFTRPIPRPLVFASRFLGGVSGFAVVLGAAAMGCGAAFAPKVGLETRHVVAAGAVATAGFLAWAAVFAALRAFLRRALFVGFFVAVIFEGMVANLPASGLSKWSVSHHLAVLLVGVLDGMAIRPPPGLAPDETAMGSAQALLAVFVVALVAGAWKVHAREIRVPPAVA